MDDLIIRTGKPRTVSECLEEARRASSPARTVEHLFLAIAYQQQQIEQLEIAVASQTEQLGEFGKEARAGVAARAKQTIDNALRGLMGV